MLAAFVNLWATAFVAAGVVTLVFASLQLSESRTHFLENWNPRQLGPMRDPDKIPLSTAIAEFAANAVFLFWWIAGASSALLFNGPTFQLSLTPVRLFFFWGYVAVFLLNMGLAVAHLGNRYWNKATATYRLMLDLAGGTLFCWLMKVNLIATLSIAGLDHTRTLALRNSIHLWMDRCFPIAVIVTAVAVVVDVMRIVRLNKKSGFVLSSGITVQGARG